MKTIALSDDLLVASLGKLAVRERQTVVAFLEHLAEFDRRRLHLRLGYPSLFQYLRDSLRFSKGSAYRRCSAARLLVRYPSIGALLLEGQLCLRSLCLLKDVLSDDNHEEVLRRAAGLTEEGVELLVATLRPQPLTRDSIRRISSISGLVLTHGSTEAENGSTVEPNFGVPVYVENGSGAEPNSGLLMAVPVPRVRLSTATPISEELSVLKVTVNREFMSDLERAKGFLSHKVASGKLDEILHECIRRVIATCEKQTRGKVAKPRTPTKPNPEPTEPRRSSDNRYIPASVKREVWQRDGGSCTYVGSSGLRCSARRRLELHHITPFALAGPPIASNLTVHCKAHNLLVARDELEGTCLTEVPASSPRSTSPAEGPPLALATCAS